MYIIELGLHGVMEFCLRKNSDVFLYVNYVVLFLLISLILGINLYFLLGFDM